MKYFYIQFILQGVVSSQINRIYGEKNMLLLSKEFALKKKPKKLTIRKSEI